MYPHVTQFETRDLQRRDDRRLHQELDASRPRSSSPRRAFGLAFAIRRLVGANR